jgi:Holliday junction DNA helicase RuvA
MIGRLEGVLAEKSPGELIVDVGGAGYEVRVPLSTFTELPEVGERVRLRVHTHVREDVLQLYGFLSETERIGFRMLIGVSGVGPRMALAILSGLRVERLAHAIREGDVSALRNVPGVGPKTAERILVDLRGRARDIELTGEVESMGASPGLEDETVSALLNLGYPRPHAEKAVRRAARALPSGAALEDWIREALRAAAG